jgi:hypothetical protein
MLHYGCLTEDTQHVHTTKDIAGGDYITSDAAVIYLPFCENCFVEVVACSDVLSKVFTISFMQKHELDEHTLWKATNTISAESMQDWLEKKLNQEESYCKLTRQKLVHGSAIGSNHVNKNAVLDVFGRIKNVHNVRMIKLMALRKNHPDFTQNNKRWPCRLGVDVGGYVGLLKSSKQANVKLPASVELKRSPIKVPSKSKAAPSISKTEKSFLNGFASLISGNEAVIKVTDSGTIIIKSFKELDGILPLNVGGSTDFQKVILFHACS